VLEKYIAWRRALEAAGEELEFVNDEHARLEFAFFAGMPRTLSAAQMADLDEEYYQICD